MDDVLKRIDDQVKNHPIVLYMKGTPQFPQCGFSARAAQVLIACEVEFDYVNVLTDPEIFQNLSRYANWPTFPQTYVSGELIGGSDILLEMHEKGELQPMLSAALEESAAKAGAASGEVAS